MKRLLIAAVLAAILPRVASAHFIDGYIGDCSANTATTCTELTATGYARQPVYFTPPVKGVVPLGYRFGFPPGVGGSITARAIYDAPTGGNLLMVLPLAAAYTIPSSGDAVDVGGIKLTFTALAALQFGEGYVGNIAASAALGTTQDGSAFVAARTLTILRDFLFPGTLTPS